MIDKLQILIDKFLYFYSANKHRSELNPFTDHLLSHALSARGYNNFRNPIESGEQFFINVILAESKPKLCIDVGANKGDYSLAILKATDAQVIAFEPLPSSFESLRHNLSEFLERVRLENMGVGAKNQELIFNYNPDVTEHASFLKNELGEIDYLNNCNSMAVPVVTLDSYVKRNCIDEVDLIKIDVEGFESEVFAGSKNVFNQVRPRFIQIEFNWHQLFRNAPLHFFARQLPGYDVF